MRPEQFILQKIIFGATERFEDHSDYEYAAINAVSTPGQLAAGNVERHHDPDAEPKQSRHDCDLAEKEQPIKTFGSLRYHLSAA